MRRIGWLFVLLFIMYGNLNAQTVFTVMHPDKELSPFTGMTRQHWKDAAKYLLQGAFSHVQRINDRMLFPQQPGKSYPKREDQIPVAILEGLCRTMFIAGPLLTEEPPRQVNGMQVGNYYRH